MKKILGLVLAGFLFVGSTFAQTKTEAKKTAKAEVKKEVKTAKAEVKKESKKVTTEVTKTKKDGTADMRYKENKDKKETAKPSGPVKKMAHPISVLKKIKTLRKRLKKAGLKPAFLYITLFTITH
jgi:hypothetical protein